MGNWRDCKRWETLILRFDVSLMDPHLSNPINSYKKETKHKLSSFPTSFLSTKKKKKSPFHNTKLYY